MTKRERLKLLIAWLTSPFIDAEAFNMEDWPTCALAEGTRLKKLRNEGLFLNNNNCPEYSGSTGVAAAAKFFGITKRDAEQTFGRTATRSPQIVAKELRRLL